MIRSRRRRVAAPSCDLLEGRQLLSGLAQDVQQLVKELQTIHAGSSVTQAEIKAVATDFKSIAAVATRPSASSVSALEAEVKLVVAGGSITPGEAVTLEKDVDAVLTSANISTPLAEQTATDIEAIVVSSGITRTEVKAVAADLKAIATDLESLKK